MHWIVFIVIKCLLRSDGLPTEPIILPTGKAFYLFQYKRDVCQKVANMQVRAFSTNVTRVETQTFFKQTLIVAQGYD